MRRVVPVPQDWCDIFLMEELGGEEGERLELAWRWGVMMEHRCLMTEERIAG